MRSLSLEELKKLGRPQVWQTQDYQFLISDGNNLCREYAKRGVNEIEIELEKEDGKFGFLIDYVELKEMADSLRRRLVFTPYDLQMARDGIIFEPPSHFPHD